MDFPTRSDWAASTRYSIPPYPSELPHVHHPQHVPIAGLNIDDLWKDAFTYDVGINDAGQLETVGITGHVCSVIGTGHSPKGAWESAQRKAEKLKIPNMQARTDCCCSTLKRLEKVREWGWL